MSPLLLAKLYDFTGHPRVAVIGDCMWDQHVYCDVLGISPEDDTAPQLRVVSERGCPGGAANVALNVASLGGRVTLFGVRGPDTEGDRLQTALSAAGVESFLTLTDRCTTLKTRIVTSRNHRHVCRTDREVILQLTALVENALLASVAVQHEREPFDIFIVSDYAKGVVTDHVLEQLHAQQLQLLVDPKGSDLRRYGPAFFITPNEKEAVASSLFACGHDIDPSRYAAAFALVKLAGRGALLHDRVTRRVIKLATRAREVGDPTGCGDSFIACLAVALGAGVNAVLAARMAVAAGACCMDHEGVHAVTTSELKTELESFNYEGEKNES